MFPSGILLHASFCIKYIVYCHPGRHLFNKAYYKYLSFKRWNFKSYSEMHLTPIQLCTVLFFSCALLLQGATYQITLHSLVCVSVDNPPPPIKTSRAQSQLFAFQCSQWEPIWNSQLIGRYKEMSVWHLVNLTIDEIPVHI